MTDDNKNPEQPGGPPEAVPVFSAASIVSLDDVHALVSAERKNREAAMSAFQIPDILPAEDKVLLLQDRVQRAERAAFASGRVSLMLSLALEAGVVTQAEADTLAKPFSIRIRPRK